MAEILYMRYRWYFFLIALLILSECKKKNFFVYTDDNTLRRLTEMTIDEIDPSWSPDGSKVAFASSNNIWSVSVSDTTPVKIVENGTYPLWSKIDGDKIIYVRYDFSSVSVRKVSLNSGETHEILRYEAEDLNFPNVAPSYLCRGIDLSTDEKHFLIQALNPTISKPEIWKVSIEDTSFTYLIDGQDPKWSPEGKRIVYVGTDDWIHIFSLTDSSDTNIITSGKDPVWSSDGYKIAYRDSTCIYVTSPQGGSRTAFPLGFSVSNLSLAPDGVFIVFRRTDTGELWIAALVLPQEP